MKKKLRIIGVILGVTVLTSIASVYAVQSVNSNDVSYDNSTSGLSSTNVKGAIDELYNAYSSPIEAGYTYTGKAEIYRAPYTGTYKVELWGASGGQYTTTYREGYGAYTSGKIALTKGQILYVYVGEEGNCYNPNGSITVDYSFNGGGRVTYANNSSNKVCNGGGATDIRITNGNWNNNISLNSRIMVAGAGAGAAYNGGGKSSGGDAGGLNGYTSSVTNTPVSVTVATQTVAGQASSFTSTVCHGKFGIGGTCAGGGTAGGGGSGYYAGSAGCGQAKPNGGGSSYISGHTGCVAIKEGSTTEPREIKISGCDTGTTNNACSIHYSNMKFTDTVMIDGKGCKWTNELTTDCSGQPQPDGTTTTGHTGNGYARITLISKS